MERDEIERAIDEAAIAAFAEAEESEAIAKAEAEIVGLIADVRSEGIVAEYKAIGNARGLAGEVPEPIAVILRYAYRAAFLDGYALARDIRGGSRATD